MFEQSAAKALGWASLGIGLSEITMPHQIEQMIGVGNGQTTGILRTLGVREIMHGVDLLSHHDPTTGAWGRVAGDVLDSALLGLAARRTRRPEGLAKVSAMVLAIGLIDLLFAGHLTRQKAMA